MANLMPSLSAPFVSPPNAEIKPGHSDLSPAARQEAQNPPAQTPVASRRTCCFDQLFSCVAKGSPRPDASMEMERIFPLTRMQQEMQAICTQSMQLQNEVRRIHCSKGFTPAYRLEALAHVQNRAHQLLRTMRDIASRLDELGERSASGRLPRAWQHELDRASDSVKDLQHMLKR